MEDEHNVSYSFHMLVVDKEFYKIGENLPYKVDTHNAYGYYTLNKKTEEFILDKEKTDPFYFTKEGKRYALKVGGLLLKILHSGEKFPERTQYAS